MDSTTIERYRKERAAHPFMPARYALKSAKAADPSEGWEEARGDNTWKRKIEGFTILLRVEQESIFPEPDKHGNTDYGSYVQTGFVRDDYEWHGNWPRPNQLPEFERTEPGLTTSGDRRRLIRFPYTAIRYSGPGWVQGEEGGYFIPSEIEDEFEFYRRRGQSRSAAWDLTKAWIEAQNSMLFHSPLTNCFVRVSAHREGVKLADTGMGTDVSGDDEGRAYIFDMVAEHGMVEEVIREAREVIAKLAATEESAA